MWKNRFQQLDLFQKRIFQRVTDFKNLLFSQVQMSENLAGVYDGLENMNERVNRLTNEIQRAFGRFYQMIMTEMRSKGPPAMVHNFATEMSQAGLARKSGERVTAQSPLSTFLNPKPSFPAAIPNFVLFLSSMERGLENSRAIEI